MNKKPRKHILPQLFDIKPMTDSGDLHLEKIHKVKKHLNLKFTADQKRQNMPIRLNDDYSRLPDGRVAREALSPILVNYWQAPVKNKEEIKKREIDSIAEEFLAGLNREGESDFHRRKILNELEEIMADKIDGNNQKTSNNFFTKTVKSNNRESRQKSSFWKFSITAVLLGALIIGGYILGGGIKSKNASLSYAILASEEMIGAKEDLKDLNFTSARDKFYKANKNFEKSKKTIGEINYLFLSAASGLPFISSTELSAVNLLDAGQYFAKAGQLISEDMAVATSINATDFFDQNKDSKAVTILKKTNSDLDQALIYINLAEKNIEKVDEDFLPNQFKERDFEDKIVQAKDAIKKGKEYISLFLDLSGAFREKNYLLLFQNPGEIRATGGFIGSYGIVKVDNGKIKKIFVDDIFNPDGQLAEKIVPPIPIQKISTAWSMHDSNWFFDFPISAQKAAWFYEKSGGQGVDAVIAINPDIMKKFLEITGPIDMPEYGVVVTAENFIDIIQYKVEKDFDKNENRPKKVLADLVPKLVGRLATNNGNIQNIVKILSESAQEKNVMAYAFDEDIQKIISKNKFSGEVLESAGDYLAVVSSNINGYKTDRMVEGSIDLTSEVASDGSVINTLTVKKYHNGGDSQYDYYNKVNADYLRVYVPKGSELLEATGHTIEKNNPPVDYAKLGFKDDKDVKSAESSLVIDKKTGTQIFLESGKTVFGNWVFVSPKEDVEVVYKYRLPRKINFDGDYEAVFQKQSGSKMELNWEIKFPEGVRIISDYPDLTIDGNFAKLNSDFRTDKIIKIRFK